MQRESEGIQEAEETPALVGEEWNAHDQVRESEIRVYQQNGTNHPHPKIETMWCC